MKIRRLLGLIPIYLALCGGTCAYAQSEGAVLLDLLRQEVVSTSVGGDWSVRERIAQSDGRYATVSRLADWNRRYLTLHAEGVEDETPLAGAITEFFVSYPFAGATQFEFMKPLSPESGFDTTKPAEGTNYPTLNWVRYRSMGHAGAVRPQEVMAQPDFQTLYLATRVVVEGTKPVAASLEIPSSSPIVAWMNGKRVLVQGDPGASPAPRFGDRWPVTLKPGENVLVIKMAMLEQTPEMYVFLTDAKTGKPVPFTVRLEEPIVSGALDTSEPGKVVKSPLRAILDDAKASLADRAFMARMILSQDAAEQKISDLLFSDLDATASMTPDEIELAVLVLDSPSRSLQILQRAMKKYAGNPQMELIYARQRILAAEEQGDTGTRFADLWAEISDKLATMKAPTVHGVSYEPLRHKIWASALAKYDQILSAWLFGADTNGCPECPNYILPGLIGRMRDLGQDELYDRTLNILYQKNRNDQGLLVEIGERMLRRASASGDDAELAHVYLYIFKEVSTRLSHISGMDYVWNFWLDVVENYGVESARATARPAYRAMIEKLGGGKLSDYYMMYLAQKPGDATRWKKYAAYSLRHGEGAEALSAYEIVAQINRQDESVQERMAAIRAASGIEADADGLDKKFEADYVVRDIPENRDPNATSIVSLLNNRVVRILENGLSAAYSQMAFQILDEQGIKQLRQMPLFYDPNEESIEIISVTTHKKDGSVRHLYKVYEQDIADESIKMYYSEKLKWIEIQDLDIGDIVEYQFKKIQTSRPTSSVIYFNDVYALQGAMNRQWSRYTVIAPEKMPIHIFVSDPTGALSSNEVHTERRDGKVIQTFEAQDLARVIPESNMPGSTEIMPTLLVSSFESWQDLVHWFLDLASAQWIADDAIRAKVHELTDGVKDPLEKLRRIHSFVVKSTRYVALEFGIHGHKPYPVPQIFARRFGDCKDKASLLKVMLREAGIDSEFVLARTRDSGDVATDLAMPALFNHAILYVPQFDMFLDGTAEFSGTRELPTMDQDGLALIMRDDGSYDLRKIPLSTASDNAVNQKSHFRLTSGDTVSYSIDVTMRGLYSSTYRDRYQIESLQRERLEAEMTSNYPGTHIDSFQFSDLEDLEKDVRLQFDAHISLSDVAKVQGNTWIIYPCINAGTTVNTFAPNAKRTMPLVLPAPVLQQKEVTIDLPPGARVVLPEPLSEKSEFGSYSLSARREGDSIVTTTTLSIEKMKITPDIYPDYIDFLRRYDQWLNTQLRIEL